MASLRTPGAGVAIRGLAASAMVAVHGAFWPLFGVGLPFIAITYFAMQEVRRLRPAQVARFMGWATATYGAGPIAGPPLAAALLARRLTPAAGVGLSLEIAAWALVMGALVYGAMVWRYSVAKRM